MIRNARGRYAELNDQRFVRRVWPNQAYSRAPRRHQFVIFRIGVDACAKCGKTLKEHKTS
jgi:hypothetical protein